MNPISWFKSRLSTRSDTELEQAFIRVLIGIGASLYLPHSVARHSEWFYTSGAYVAVIVTFMLAAFVIVGIILVRPEPSPARRVIANVLDVTTITAIMIGGNDHTAPIFFVYLWVTFGCGFRFGPRYLLISLGLSIAGFIAVMFFSDYWARNSTMSIGILLGMTLLSLYVHTLVKRLYEALDRAAEANQAKRRFVSSVSHELRTPLNAIIGMTDLLRATPLDTEQSEMTSTMHSASRVMLSLIEDVLDFSKIEAGKLNIESVDFDLHSLVHSTITIFSRQAAMKGLKLGVFVMPDVAHALTGDAHHLQQVLVNLLGNAVKFTEHGEIRVAVSALTDGPQTVRLRFAVRDTGIGIPLAEQARVFESFAQADSLNVRKHRGTGLGTTIAKQLVELMGGSMGLESAPGAGSTFWFDLPFAKQKISSEIDPSRIKNNRVLLVGFPDQERQDLVSVLQQWEMGSGYADSASVAAARLAEAAALDRPYRVALIYAESTQTDMSVMASELGAGKGGDTLSLILCAPRDTTATWSARLPADFSSVIGYPLDKRLLYNALHSILAGDQAALGVVSLAEYYQRKEPTKSYRILVADDDQINRRVIEKQLQKAGHQVKLVADGEQALDAMDEADYDVVILDSNMPVMTGIEATRLIRVMQAGRASVPIILFSADATQEVIQEAMDAGVDVFLSKPLEATKLYSTIEQLAGKRPMETSTVVRAIEPQKTISQAPLLDINTLHDLERMSEDPQFVRQLAGLFREDSMELLSNIENALAHHRREDFKSQIHALKGSALNLGAKRLFVHCMRIGVLDYREVESSSVTLSAETRLIITETNAALTDYLEKQGEMARSTT